MIQKTPHLPQEKIKREWHLLDASGQTLGRFATRVASLLIGKNKPTFSFHHDHGDFVVVINAAEIKVTGRKKKQKIYYHHSGYTGNLKELTFQQMMEKDPRKVITLAVKGMLPRNRQLARRLRRLKVFNDGHHNYQTELGGKNG